MLCAPFLYFVRVNSLIRANDTINNNMALSNCEQASSSAAPRGRLTAPYVTLTDGAMEHPLRHFFSHRFPRAAHVSCVRKGKTPPRHGGRAPTYTNHSGAQAQLMLPLSGPTARRPTCSRSLTSRNCGGCSATPTTSASFSRATASGRLSGRCCRTSRVAYHE
jgi:hypothetical protein